MTPAAAFLAAAAGVAVAVALRHRASRARPSPTGSPPPSTGPTPDAASLVKPEVWASFPAWIEQYEGRKSWMYRDTHPAGLVSSGVGNLLDPIALAMPLPWLRPDNTAATQNEIRADWTRVKALPRAMLAERYRTPAALHLAETTITQLVHQTMAIHLRAVAKTFPDIASYPAPVQTAILGMAWLAGPYNFFKRPAFVAAARARDWKAAANTCKLKNATATRDDAHRALFLSAVGTA